MTFGLAASHQRRAPDPHASRCCNQIGGASVCQIDVPERGLLGECYRRKNRGSGTPALASRGAVHRPSRGERGRIGPVERVICQGARRSPSRWR
jgi:hypothetical protein